MTRHTCSKPSTVFGIFSFLLVCVGAARACRDSDWVADFTDCDERNKRHVFVSPAAKYVLGKAEPVCDIDSPKSRPVPQPLLNTSCKKACPAGTRLGINLVANKATWPVGPVEIQPTCIACPVGKFTMGGGVLAAGTTWKTRRPSSMTTVCSIADVEKNAWPFAGVEAQACKISVESPSSIASHYTALPASWNKLARTRKLGPGSLVMAPGKGKLCQVPATSLHKAVVLVRNGGCSAERKANNARIAHASGVILMTDSYANSISEAPATYARQAPTIPLFTVKRQDGDLMAVALQGKARGLVTLGNMSASCSSLADSQAQCESWKPDSSGKFIHSGNQWRFNRVASALNWAVKIVRPGHVMFRYMVDATESYTSLVFLVDEMEILVENVLVRDWRELKVNLAPGYHQLRWIYRKYREKPLPGEDKAKIELIEVFGTSWSDPRCISCEGVKKVGRVTGSSSCNACRRNQYLKFSSKTSGTQCVNCRSNYWSEPGSIGNTSCQKRLPCVEEDLVIEYTPCRAFERRRQMAWRKPVICDSAQRSAQEMIEHRTTKVPCEECQPFEHRPDGDDCVPREVDCPHGYYGAQELAFNRWRFWPTNFTHELGGMSASERVAEQGVGWKLNKTYAYVSPEDIVGISEVSATSTALLHLECELFSVGEVSFHFESPMATEEFKFGRALQFLVDNTFVEAVSVKKVDNRSSLATVPLESGEHKLTWSFQLTDGPNAWRAGFKLYNVTVTNAVGGGARRCSRCPAGHEVSPNGVECSICPAGSYNDGEITESEKSSRGEGARRECKLCPENTFSASAGAVKCTPCGHGTVAFEGSWRCRISALLETEEFDDVEHMRYDVGELVVAWEYGMEFTGPFEVNGGKYHFSFFTPVGMPGMNPDMAKKAFIWEKSRRQGALRGPHGTCIQTGTGSDYASIGSVITAAYALNVGSLRGIEVEYAGRPCGNGKTHQTIILFRCDPQEVDLTLRQDRDGVYHLPRFTLVDGEPYEDIDGCRSYYFEWPTSKACPRCRKSDFVSETSECDAEGYQNVTYQAVGPCWGGRAKPSAKRQECVMGRGHHASQVMFAVILFVVLASLFGAGLCCYVLFLHCKYGKLRRVGLNQGPSRSL